jgi:4-hydroxy-3-methylbut-2-enyl diphosphate reductase
MRRKQIVASQRVILEAEKAEREAIKAEKLDAFFNSIQVGDVVKGTPVRFAEFGAFVQVDGFDCLAHVSDLSWTGCTNPAEVLELNKEYEFKILKADREKQKVSIGYKQLMPKPWELVSEKYNVGDVVNGKVVRIVSFGAFVEVEKGVDGLVHVSQISNKWLENPLGALEIGQEVEAKIMAIDTEKEKMTLSIKALLPEEPKKEVKVVEEVVENEEPELKEWIDDDTSSISIAEMIGKLDD